VIGSSKIGAMVFDGPNTGCALSYRLRVSSTGGDTSVARNKLQLLHSEKLAKLPWLVHASPPGKAEFRVYGGKALNLGFTPHDSRAAVERNRELFLKELGVASGRRSWPLISLRQIIPI